MSKRIYDYANENNNTKQHISFNDVFSTLLDGIDCVVCLESSADLLGYSNGGFRSKIKIYTEKDYNLPYLECHIVNDLSKISFINSNGIRVTPIEQTMLDLLKNEQSDDQIILETFANYYFENDNSFAKINPPKELVKRFTYFKKEGSLYYDS